MPILGGSPLGIIGVSSGPTKDGMSTFNGGRSRNLNVNLYNSGKDADKDRIAKSKVSSKGGAFSMFTGGNYMKPWAGVKMDAKAGFLDDEGYSGISRRTLHNNDVYDTSILNIIEKLSGTKASLKPTDFAYLKDLGVYPNNRLIIARRYGGAVGDNILYDGARPQATLIDWRKPEEEFLEISFGEEWEEAKADFTDMLNKISEDILGKQVGGSVAGGLGALPLPGWTEGLQREVLASFGVLEQRATLPAGDPNLIKQAKRRKTVPYGEAGSGLKCSVSIKMEVEYEQKFISGIDPTIVYIDIIQNALRFGTSNSSTYGLSGGFAATIMKFVEDPIGTISAMAQKIVDKVNKVIQDVKNYLNDVIKNASDGSPEAENKPEKTEKEQAEDVLKQAEKFFSKITNSLLDSIKKTIQKYAQEVKGIIAALTGGPSTCHHVTIGNPLRPVFCAGDLYPDNVILNFGPNLAFNDLPATIKVSFTLQNARPWGLQEILAKFNQGNVRIVNPVADANSIEGPLSNTTMLFNEQKPDQAPITASPSVATTTPSTGSNTAGGGDAGNKTAGSTTKDGAQQPTVNTNPNSTQPPVTGDSPNTKTVTLPSGTFTQAQLEEEEAQRVAAEAAAGGGLTGPSVDETALLTSKNGATVTQQQQAETKKNDDPTTDANATSKRGYTYELKTKFGDIIYEKDGKLINEKGTVPFIEVKDKDGKIVTNFESDTAFKNPGDTAALIKEAKVAVNDN